MYSVVCRKVRESPFTLTQIQESVSRARRMLDYERVELTPDLMDKLLSEREKTEHKGKTSKRIFHIEEEKNTQFVYFFSSTFHAITSK